MSSGFAKVMVIAMMANLSIALAKFAGAYFSKSSALLAETVHSGVETTHQILLLLGEKTSKKKPDDAHPLGYGRETFFWSFVVTLLLFTLGGLFAIYEGVHKLGDPHRFTIRRWPSPFWESVSCSKGIRFMPA